MKIVREMGYTHADFFRLLPNAMGETPYKIDGLTVTGQLETGTVTITLGPEGERKLVLVVLPRTEITFEYSDVSNEERSDFIKYFDLRFMKGLG